MPDTPSAAAKTLAPNRRMVWLLALASFASTSTIRVLDPALPQLALAFDITTGQAAKVVTVFAIAYGLMLFVFGPIGDRFGKYKTLSLATLACSVSSLLVALAPSFEWLLVARVVSAITGRRSCRSPWPGLATTSLMNNVKPPWRNSPSVRSWVSRQASLLAVFLLTRWVGKVPFIFWPCYF